MRLTLLLGLSVALAQALVIHVPSEQPTIQAGLNAARTGDTVLVASGTYFERLTWPARDGITLLSEAGPDSTIVNARDSGRVVTMNALDYTSATRLCGFTLTRGLVSTYPGNGAGLWCRGSPEICHNHITDNHLSTMGYGGGVYADGAPLFHDNLVAWDTIWNEGGGGWRYGAGVFCSGSGIFIQNVFLENCAMGGEGGFWYGGGLHLAGGRPVVFANLFLRNRMGTSTGGISYGGGLYVNNATAYVVNNTFVANVCSTAITHGAGIFVENSSTSIVKNNILFGNICDGLGRAGGAIASYPDTLGETLDVDYNDVWANLPDAYYGVRVGLHSLALDPLFVTGARGPYYLSQTAAGQPETSPCCDAGDTVMRTPVNLDSLIHAWTTRTDSVPDMGVPDMGYHYCRTVLTGSTEIPAATLARHAFLPGITRGRVRFMSGRPGVLWLIDAAGRRALKHEVNAGSNTLELAGLRPGVYLARLESPDQTSPGRLVKLP
ncbi:MAG: right-handed parallel beta-helix repeat-containing protein [candidate division WOR-3 bacterium]